MIYEKGEIPKQWLLSTFVLISKKPNPRECSEYRTIALMSHTLKLFLKIIHKRIYKKLEEGISNTQFGFREGLGTREALFGINVLFQRCLDMNQKVFACYIDFEKAFDKVKHDKLYQLLLKRNVDSDDIRIISNLYWDQRANTRVDNKLTEEMEILRGLRQGCILSPLLFNLYSESIFNETLEEETAGVVINGQTVNNLRYADDTVMLTTNLGDMQHLLDKLNNKCNEYGLKINFKKTKLMIITKSQQDRDQLDLIVANTLVENVQIYKYLGTWVEQSGEQTREIRTRIEIARAIFVKMKKFFTSRDIDIKLKMRMLRCYVFSTLLYGVESWTLKKKHMTNLQAFEMWCYRRMWRISWVDRITNTEVLDKMQKDCEIITTIKKKKLQYIGHIMRNSKYTLLQLIMQGKILGKRNIGRRRMSWLKNLRDWFNCSNTQLFRAAVNKVRIAVMIANLR
jgi:Reverse transcriptase (RNA-dependent DNA polymerase)